jgi:hypothetical protein
MKLTILNLMSPYERSDCKTGFPHSGIPPRGQPP